LTEPDPAGKVPGPDGLREGVNLYLKKLRKARTGTLPGMKQHLKRIYREDTAEAEAGVPGKVWGEALEEAPEEADFVGGVAVAECKATALTFFC